MEGEVGGGHGRAAHPESGGHGGRADEEGVARACGNEGAESLSAVEGVAEGERKGEGVVLGHAGAYEEILELGFLAVGGWGMGDGAVLMIDVQMWKRHVLCLGMNRIPPRRIRTLF